MLRATEMCLIWILIIVSNLFEISVFCLTPEEIEAQRSGWNINPHTQYHIQTDEGPERYFRFQTLNGQFRKEKRLEDGTVIGTEGWMDPLGYLRIKDYIADSEGFRILKSRTIHVGKDRSNEDTLTGSIDVPAQTGTFIKPRRPPYPFKQSLSHDISGNSVESNLIKPYRIFPPSTGSSRRYTVSSTTQSYPRSDYYSTTITNEQKTHPYVNNRVIEILPKKLRHNGEQINKQQPIRVVSESRHGVYRPTSTRHRAAAASGRFNDTYRPIRKHRPIYTYQKYDKAGGRYFQDVTEKTGNEPVPRRPNHSRTATCQFPPCTGIHKPVNGFNYYLKSHYHEEEEQFGKKIGSFGYIDPFGIKRVVYYQADDKNGFLHKKNNKYVGINSTSYDSDNVLQPKFE